MADRGQMFCTVANIHDQIITREESALAPRFWCTFFPDLPYMGSGTQSSGSRAYTVDEQRSIIRRRVASAARYDVASVSIFHELLLGTDSEDDPDKANGYCPEHECFFVREGPADKDNTMFT